MLKETETTGIEGQYGMTIRFELDEPEETLHINNESEAYVEFTLHGDLGKQ